MLSTSFKGGWHFFFNENESFLFFCGGCISPTGLGPGSLSLAKSPMPGVTVEAYLALQ